MQIKILKNFKTGQIPDLINQESFIKKKIKYIPNINMLYAYKKYN